MWVPTLELTQLVKYNFTKKTISQTSLSTSSTEGFSKQFRSVKNSDLFCYPINKETSKSSTSEAKRCKKNSLRLTLLSQ